MARKKSGTNQNKKYNKPKTTKAVTRNQNGSKNIRQNTDEARENEKKAREDANKVQKDGKETKEKTSYLDNKNESNVAMSSVEKGQKTAKRKKPLKEAKKEKQTKVTSGKKAKIKKAVTTVGICCLFLIFAGVGAAMALYKLGTSQINYVAEGKLEDADVSAELLYEKDVINILLIGADKRAKEESSGRSDTTMIATLDLNQGKIKLTSLMRDMYIEIPGHGKNKFNAAYAYGGPQLTYETIANTFGVKLDGYVVVDLKAFRKIVDAMGGVDLKLTKAEAKYLQTAYKNGTHGVKDVKAGKQTLTGWQALAYVRIRQDITGEFGRTDRQRKVLMSMYDQLMEKDPVTISNTVFSALEYVTTDLDEEHIRSLVTSVISMGKVTIEQHRIPLEGTYDSGRVEEQGNMWVMFPDYDTNKKALQYFMFETGEAPDTVEYFNQGADDFLQYEAPEKLEGGSTY